MKITLIQTEIKWQDVDYNLTSMESIIAEAGNTDLIVLPEMFSTGFSMEVDKWNENLNNQVINWMTNTAKKYSTAIAGSTLFMEDRKFFNRLLFMEQNGFIQKYDKRHLFGDDMEKKVFQQGKSRNVFEFGLWKIFPGICYDLRFPVWSRNNLGYDLLIYVANWPQQRDEHWKTLLRARAIENQCYVIGVNRLGQDNHGISYIGNSCVIAYDGSILTMLDQNKNTGTIEINRDDMLDYRRKLNFLPDQDSFHLI